MQEVVAALRQLPLLSGATEEELVRLSTTAFSRRLARGQVLFVEGDRSEHLHVLVRGRVKVVVGSDDGSELVLAVLGPGDPLGELSVLDGAHRSAGAVALDDVVLWSVPAEAVRSLVQQSAAVALAAACELAGQVRRLTGAAADLVFLDLPRRLAKLLASRDDLSGLSQSELAAQLGVARQSLNRALQRLQDEGWVQVQRGQVAVVDRSALLRFAQS